jgi:hypothetical protein
MSSSTSSATATSQCWTHIADGGSSRRWKWVTSEAPPGPAQVFRPPPPQPQAQHQHHYRHQRQHCTSTSTSTSCSSLVVVNSLSCRRHLWMSKQTHRDCLVPETRSLQGRSQLFSAVLVNIAGRHTTGSRVLTTHSMASPVSFRACCSELASCWPPASFRACCSELASCWLAGCWLAAGRRRPQW